MPKKKGTPGGNHTPVRPPEVESLVYKRDDKDPYPDVPLAKKALQIKMYTPIMERLNKMDSIERTLWLRKTIAEAAIKDLGVKIDV